MAEGGGAMTLNISIEGVLHATVRTTTMRTVKNIVKVNWMEKEYPAYRFEVAQLLHGLAEHIAADAVDELDGLSDMLAKLEEARA
jgi:hypothetical protein